MLTRKLTKNYAYLEILHLDNPSEEALFEINQIKGQHEIMKLQKEEVKLMGMSKS